MFAKIALDKAKDIIYNKNTKRQDLKRLCQKLNYFTTADLGQRAAVVLLWNKFPHFIQKSRVCKSYAFADSDR